MKENKIYQFLFSALKAGLSGEKINLDLLRSLNSNDWQSIVSLVQQHNITPLVCDGLAAVRDMVPANIFAMIAGLTLIAEDKYAARLQVIEDLGQLFAEHKIPFMVLKGYGISLYYPKPIHRAFSDVDMYSLGSFQKADDILQESLGIGISNEVHHHTTCVYKGILIENHYDIINTVQHRSNARFEEILKDEAAKDIKEHSIGEFKILLPSAMFNALFLMRHMAMHYAAERVSLRHLCDWMLFIKAEYNNIDWARVDELYQQFNMKRFADAITGICIEHLGLSADYIPNTIRDKALESRILNDIVFSEFKEKKPNKGFIRIVWWKMRRYFSNRWKHTLIYNESWVWTFFTAIYAHLLKPKTITH